MTAAGDADRFRLLEAVADLGAATFGLEQLVARLLEVIVPAYADLALLDVLGRRGETQRLGARVAERHDREAVELALMRRRRRPDAPLGVAKTLRSAEAQLLVPVTEEHIQAIATGEEDAALLRGLGLESALFIPLQARNRTLGVLACATTAPRRPFRAEDVAFARVLAGRVALALDNAGLFAEISGLERRLDAVLTNLAEAVMVRDARGEIIFANPAAARMVRLDSVQEVERAEQGSLMALFEVTDEAGRPLQLEDMPVSRAQRGEQPEPMLVRNVDRRTGEERWLVSKATPVFEPDGRLAMVVTLIEDVTEVKRAELAQRLLAEAGEALSSSLDYGQTLQRVAELAVPGLADWCGVVMRGARDELEQVAVAHVDPAKLRLVRDWGRRYRAPLGRRSVAAAAIRTREPQVLSEIDEEAMARFGLEPEQRALLQQLGMGSVLVVPMSLPDRPPLGVLSLVMAESGRRFSTEHMALAQELARRAAMAVENARLYTERSRVAVTLQESLLPPTLPAIPGFRVASLYRVGGETTMVGGDFYDAFAVPGGWLVCVGDVTGRGAEAAALTSLSRWTLRTAAQMTGDPVAAVQQLNRALCERTDLSLVTVCCAMLRETAEGPVADVVLAGHPPAYLLHGASARPAGRLAPVLGVDSGVSWATETVRLTPGDRLVLYTDGVVESAGAQERFGEERLAACLAAAPRGTDAVIEHLERELGAFVEGEPADDIAVLVVECAPIAGAGAPTAVPAPGIGADDPPSGSDV